MIHTVGKNSDGWLVMEVDDTGMYLQYFGGDKQALVLHPDMVIELRDELIRRTDRGITDN